MTTLAVDWGPVGVWVSAAATVLAVIVATLVALRFFDGLRGPRIHLTFAYTEPWCRHSDKNIHGRQAGLWIRLGVENRGAAPARGCVGRLITVTTDGTLRSDVDPYGSAGRGFLAPARSTPSTFGASSANTSTSSTCHPTHRG